MMTERVETRAGKRKQELPRLFITGVFRSGTTLLSRILSGDDRIASSSDFFLFAFKLIDTAYRSKLGLGEFPLMLDMLCTSEGYKEVFNTQIVLSEVVSACEEIKGTKVLDDIGTYSSEYLPLLTKKLNDMEPDCLIRGAELVDIVYETVADYHLETRGSVPECASVKMLFGNHFSEALLSSNESIRVLHIYRDPRSVYMSRNSGKYLSAIGSRYPARMLGTLWDNDILLSDRLMKKFPKRFMSIKYEDLVLSPNEVVTQVMDFIYCSSGRDSASDLEFISELNAQAFNINNSSFDKPSTRETLDKNAMKRGFMAKIPYDELVELENICYAGMISCGYDFCSQDKTVEQNKYEGDKPLEAKAYQPWTLKYLERAASQSEFNRICIESASISACSSSKHEVMKISD